MGTQSSLGAGLSVTMTNSEPAKTGEHANFSIMDLVDEDKKQQEATKRKRKWLQKKLMQFSESKLEIKEENRRALFKNLNTKGRVGKKKVMTQEENIQRLKQKNKYMQKNDKFLFYMFMVFRNKAIDEDAVVTVEMMQNMAEILEVNLSKDFLLIPFIHKACRMALPPGWKRVGLMYLHIDDVADKPPFTSWCHFCLKGYRQTMKARKVQLSMGIPICKLDRQKENGEWEKFYFNFESLTSYDEMPPSDIEYHAVLTIQRLFRIRLIQRAWRQFKAVRLLQRAIRAWLHIRREELEECENFIYTVSKKFLFRLKLRKLAVVGMHKGIFLKQDFDNDEALPTNAAEMMGMDYDHADTRWSDEATRVKKLYKVKRDKPQVDLQRGKQSADMGSGIADALIDKIRTSLVGLAPDAQRAKVRQLPLANLKPFPVGIHARRMLDEHFCFGCLTGQLNGMTCNRDKYIYAALRLFTNIENTTGRLFMMNRAPTSAKDAGPQTTLRRFVLLKEELTACEEILNPKKCLKDIKRFSNMRIHWRCIAWNIAGHQFASSGEPDLAIKSICYGMHVAELSEYVFGVGYSHAHLAVVYRKGNKPNEALAHSMLAYERAGEVVRQERDQFENVDAMEQVLAEIGYNLAINFLVVNQYSSAVNVMKRVVRDYLSFTVTRPMKRRLEAALSASMVLAHVFPPETTIPMAMTRLDSVEKSPTSKRVGSNSSPKRLMLGGIQSPTRRSKSVAGMSPAKFSSKASSPVKVLSQNLTTTGTTSSLVSSASSPKKKKKKNPGSPNKPQKGHSNSILGDSLVSEMSTLSVGDGASSPERKREPLSLFSQQKMTSGSTLLFDMYSNDGEPFSARLDIALPKNFLPKVLPPYGVRTPNHDSVEVDVPAVFKDLVSNEDRMASLVKQEIEKMDREGKRRASNVISEEEISNLMKKPAGMSSCAETEGKAETGERAERKSLEEESRVMASIALLGVPPSMEGLPLRDSVGVVPEDAQLEGAVDDEGDADRSPGHHLRRLVMNPKPAHAATPRSERAVYERTPLLRLHF